MKTGQLRLVAVVWTIAALFDLAAVVAMLADGDAGWRLWLAIALLVLFTGQAVAYWLIWTRRRQADRASDPARP